MADDDDLDAMMGGSAPAPAAAAATNASAPATAASTATASAPAAASAAGAMDDEDDEDDDDDGVNLVLDAPSSTPVRGGPGGAFGTPLSLQSSSRFSKWGAPNSAQSQQQPHATPVAAATPTGAPAAAAQFPVSSGAPAAAPAAAAASRSTLTLGGSAAAGALGAGRTTGGASSAADADRDSNRPFRLPMPSDHIFEAGSHLDARALIDRPWLAPGADPTDWFNYGFEEETWKLYCQKQIQSRINAKLKSKVTVFDGDEGSSAPRAPPGGGAMRPPMPMPMPMPPHGMMGGMMAPGMMQPGMMPGMQPYGMPHMGMQQPMQPMRPPPQFQQQQPQQGGRGGQSIASFDGDDASVPLTRATGPRNPAHQPTKRE